MTTGKYIAWLICCVILIIFLTISGIYMLSTGLGGWAFFPFIMALGVGAAGSETINENNKKDPKENDNV